MTVTPEEAREWIECGGVYQRDDGPVVVFPDVEALRALLTERDSLASQLEAAQDVIEAAELYQASVESGDGIAIQLNYRGLADALAALDASRSEP